MLRLTWGADHSLSFVQTEPAGGWGTLHLRKPGGDQDIAFSGLESKLTVAKLEAAWNEQGKQWDELFLFQGPPFIALRAIWLPDRWCILWSVFHFDSAPHDVCQIVRMSRSELPFVDKIRAVPLGS